MTRALGPALVETRACARREAIGRHRSSRVAAWGAGRAARLGQGERVKQTEGLSAEALVQACLDAGVGVIVDHSYDPFAGPLTTAPAAPPPR